MLRINRVQQQHLTERFQLSSISVPPHEIVCESERLTDAEFYLFMLILEHSSMLAADRCLKDVFVKSGYDEITYKRTKWSLMGKQLIDCDELHQFYYVGNAHRIKMNKVEMDISFAALESEPKLSDLTRVKTKIGIQTRAQSQRQHQTQTKYFSQKEMSATDFFYPHAFCFFMQHENSSVTEKSEQSVESMEATITSKA